MQGAQLVFDMLFGTTKCMDANTFYKLETKHSYVATFPWVEIAVSGYFFLVWGFYETMKTLL